MLSLLPPSQSFRQTGSGTNRASERCLSQLSLLSWDQLVTAADKWLRGQRSCRESLCQAECTKGHSPGNSGARLPSYCPFMQLFVNNGLLWKYLRQAKKKKMQLSKGGKKHNSSGLTQTVSAASNLSGLTEASNLHLFAHKSRTSKRCIWAVQ